MALPAPDPPLSLPIMAGAAADALPGQVLTGEIDDGNGFALLNGDEGAAPDDSDPVARLRRLIEERQAESVEILRGWMELDEERA